MVASLRIFDSRFRSLVAKGDYQWRPKVAKMKICAHGAILMVNSREFTIRSALPTKLSICAPQERFN